VSSSVLIDGHMVLAQVPQYANARYHLPAMYLACGLAGLGVATVLALLRRCMGRDVPAVRFLAFGIICLAAVPRVDLLRRMWTPQQEFELFRDGLAKVSPTCRVVSMVSGLDAGFVPFAYLVPGGLLDIDEFLSDPPVADCFVYYRGGNCYALDLVPEAERG